MQDGLHQAADDLAQEIERTIAEGEEFLEDGPSFVPRSDKYQSATDYIPSLEDLNNVA